MTTPEDAMLRGVAVGELIEELFPDRSADSRPERNTMTGCLTGHGVEQVTAALIRDDSVAAVIIREQVKVYCSWLDDPTRTSDDGPDAAAELIRHAMLIHGVADTHRDFANILDKLVQAHRNGVRF